MGGEAKQILGWAPQMGFHDLVHIMVDADLEAGRPAQVARRRAGASWPSSFSGWHRWDEQVISMEQNIA